MSVTRDIKDVRDAFNRGINPIINTIGHPYDGDLRYVRNVMNKDINAVIREINGVTPPTPTKVIEECSFGLWAYTTYLRKAWKGVDERDALAEARELAEYLASIEYGYIEGLTWVDTGKAEHAHMNGKTPFKLSNGAFSLTEWSPRYWHLAEQYLNMCKEVGIQFIPFLVLREYSERPFQQNINGVHKLKSYDAIPYVQGLARRWGNCFADVYGSDYRPMVKIANEFTHRNKDDFHFNGDFHKAVAEAVMEFTTIDRIIFDASKSEGVIMHMYEIHECGKPYAQGEMHGNDEYDRNDPKNSILKETHNCSVEYDLTHGKDDDDGNGMTGEQYAGLYSSKWKRLKFSGDGGDAFNIASINIPGTGFYFPNAEELEGCLRYVFKVAQRKNPHKRIYYCRVDPYTYKTNDGEWDLWMPNINIKTIDKGTAEVVPRVFKEHGYVPK